MILAANAATPSQRAAPLLCKLSRSRLVGTQRAGRTNYCNTADPDFHEGREPARMFCGHAGAPAADRSVGAVV